MYVECLRQVAYFTNGFIRLLAHSSDFAVLVLRSQFDFCPFNLADICDHEYSPQMIENSSTRALCVSEQVREFGPLTMWLFELTEELEKTEPPHK